MEPASVVVEENSWEFDPEHAELYARGFVFITNVALDPEAIARAIRLATHDLVNDKVVVHDRAYNAGGDLEPSLLSVWVKR